jgi:DUF1365 family protein
VIPATPACYDVEVVHRRTAPVAHRVLHTMTTWLVDADDPPRLPGPLNRLCRFDPADHVDVRRLLAEHGVDPARVLMLAQPRVYGYVFNPLTVFYCLSGPQRLTHVVAEVRNTYGGRHAYVMAADQPRAEKVLYVSPFNAVDGVYTLRLPLPGDRLTVAVTLHRAGHPPFSAAMTGVRRSDARLSDALRRPLETRAVTAGIRAHGLALYRQGLRPYPRPPRRAHPPAHPLAGPPTHPLTPTLPRPAPPEPRPLVPTSPGGSP